MRWAIHVHCPPCLHPLTHDHLQHPTRSQVYQSASVDYNTISPLVPNVPGVESAQLLQGADGGLWIACSRYYMDWCDNRGVWEWWSSYTFDPTRTLTYDINNSEPPKVAVAISRPIVGIDIFVFEDGVSLKGGLPTRSVTPETGWMGYRSIGLKTWEDATDLLTYVDVFNPEDWANGNSPPVKLGPTYTAKIRINVTADDNYVPDPFVYDIRGAWKFYDPAMDCGPGKELVRGDCVPCDPYSVSPGGPYAWCKNCEYYQIPNADQSACVQGEWGPVVWNRG